MAILNPLPKTAGRCVAFSFLLLVCLLLNGCQTTAPDAPFTSVTELDPLAPKAAVPAPDPAVKTAAPAAAKPLPAAPVTTATPPATSAGSASAPVASSALSMTLRVGDSLTISYSDTPIVMPTYDGRIKDDGKITIPPYSQTFVAAGKNVRELEEEIRERYVPKYFKQLTVSIKSELLFFSVDGEVRSPNRYPYSGQMTVLGAIATASGFTDFAKKTKVQVTRADGKTKETVNCSKAIGHPEFDRPIYPGDQVHVPRRFF